MPTGPSPFTPTEAEALAEEKFRDPLVTAKGERRAHVGLHRLETLWFNTGSLCNLACTTCFMESSPTNDALVYLTAEEVARFLDEADVGFDASEIGFTGGEPFMNPDIIAMLSDALERGYEVLVLSNAMKPMRRHEAALLELKQRHGERLTIRVSLDHYTRAAHEGERGANSWEPAVDGLRWLSDRAFSIAVAGRHLPHEDDGAARLGYADLFRRENIAIDAADPSRLVLFPEMDETKDVPEITTACWGILDTDPRSIMCASSRMVVHKKGADKAGVIACTLLPYDDEFDLGETLAAANHPVSLNHPHCARFCVLGGASCS
ncbi:radical SAM protein [Novosphingopyxis sp.]|uniref:radical SAM protein n=1 Tax=Novosphingopyxis sp. TaxID=2709690 RepID=UPI003B592BBE